MINPWTAEKLDPSNLLLIWKDITHALITSGRSADLYQELCSAITARHEELAIHVASGPAFHHQQESSPSISRPDKAQTPANSTGNGIISLRCHALPQLIFRQATSTFGGVDHHHGVQAPI
jgi:hypothetical protein